MQTFIAAYSCWFEIIGIQNSEVSIRMNFKTALYETTKELEAILTGLDRGHGGKDED